MEEKFVLVSLNDRKSKKIAEVISNETARRILDYLGEKDKVSPIELSKKMNVPISTITYNLKILHEQGLIVKDDEVYSDKGRKVSLYSIAKKMILIIPKGVDWKDSIKKILPVFILGTLATIGTYVYEHWYRITEQNTVVEDFAIQVESEVVTKSFESNAISITKNTEYWPYIFGVTLLVILIILIIKLWRKRK